MKTLILLVMLGFSSSSFAYQYFPMVNKGSLGAELNGGYRNFSYEEDRRQPVKAQVTGSSVNGSAEIQFGLFQSVTMFGKFAYSNTDSTSKIYGSPDLKTTKSGIEDFEIGMRGKLDFLGNFLWGGSLLISPGNQTYKTNSNADSIEISNNSGGFIAVPKLGYQFMWGPARVGIIASYDFILGNRKLDVTESTGITSDYNVKGGSRTTIDGFGEFHLGEVDLIGVSVASLNTEKATKTSGTQNLAFTNSTSQLRVRTYGRKSWGSVWFQPYIDFNRNLDTDISSEVDFAAGATFRFFF